MEIVFCERCGVSIPEHQVVGTRQSSGGRDLCATCNGPGTITGDLDLYFCENCRVSIPVPAVLTGEARPDGSGYLCAICSQAAPQERVARRVAVERELEVEVPPGTAAPSPPTTPRPAPPIYFCDLCNASIPAEHVATGRALLQGGHTFCAPCRPRAEARSARGGGGAGVIPALAASLVGAAAALGGYIAWERKVEAGRPAVDAAQVARDRRIDALSQQVRDAADVAENRSLEALGRLETELGALRAELGSVREAAEAAGDQASGVKRLVGGGGPGEPDRLSRLETRLAEADLEMKNQFRVMGESLEARLVEALGENRGNIEDGAPDDGATSATDPMGGSGVPDEQPTPVPAAEENPSVVQNIELLGSKDDGVRFAAAIELGRLGDPRAVPALVKGLREDPDVFVRSACSRSLGDLKAYISFPDLVDAMSDAEEYVSKRAALVVKEFSGEDFGYKQGQTKAERKRVADRARKWWEDNKQRLLNGG